MELVHSGAAGIDCIKASVLDIPMRGADFSSNQQRKRQNDANLGLATMPRPDVNKKVLEYIEIYPPLLSLG